MIPLMPSPGSPKIVSTPQSASRSMRTSEAIFDMAYLLRSAAWFRCLPKRYYPGPEWSNHSNVRMEASAVSLLHGGRA